MVLTGHLNLGFIWVKVYFIMKILATSNIFYNNAELKIWRTVNGGVT